MLRLLGVSEVDVAQVFQDVGEVDGGAAVGDLDMAPAFERGEQHEQVGSAVALVLVVIARRLSWPHRHRRARLGHELLGGLVEAHEWPGLVVRARVDFEGILHRGVVAKHASGIVAKHASGMTNAALALGGMTQYSFRCGLSEFFLAPARPY